MGCSTAGEIHNKVVSDLSLSCAYVEFEKSQLKFCSEKIETAEKSYESALKMAHKLNHPNLKGVFILSEGLLVNGSEITKAFNEVLKVPITGGLAGDGAQFKKTWVLNQGVPSLQSLTAVGFYGEQIHFDHGTKAGWDIFGVERLITKAQGNILYELDGKPCLEIYKKYLGDKAKELPLSALYFPLQITNPLTGQKIIRTILGVNEIDQSMIFAGDVPVGSKAQLMRANLNSLIEGAYQATQQIQNSSAQEQTEQALQISISCVGRKLVLGGRVQEEVEAVYDSNSQRPKHQVGFYSYGEIGPTEFIQSCELHNQTMTLTYIRED